MLANLIYRTELKTEKKRNENNYKENKNLVAQKKRSDHKSVEAMWRNDSESVVGKIYETGGFQAEPNDPRDAGCRDIHVVNKGVRLVGYKRHSRAMLYWRYLYCDMPWRLKFRICDDVI